MNSDVIICVVNAIIVVDAIVDDWMNIEVEVQLLQVYNTSIDVGCSYHLSLIPDDL